MGIPTLLNQCSLWKGPSEVTGVLSWPTNTRNTLESPRVLKVLYQEPGKKINALRDTDPGSWRNAAWYHRCFLPWANTSRMKEKSRHNFRIHVFPTSLPSPCLCAGEGCQAYPVSLLLSQQFCRQYNPVRASNQPCDIGLIVPGSRLAYGRGFFSVHRDEPSKGQSP